MTIIQAKVWSPGGALPDDFLMLPHHVYQDDVYWPGESALQVISQFSTDNRWFQQGKAWVGCIAGKSRLAGFISPDLINGECAAFFGYWETTDSLADNQALFAELTQWAKRHKAVCLYGPINFSTFGHYRLRVDNFGIPSFRGEPYNPSWYPRLLSKMGFKVCYYYSSCFDYSANISENIQCDYQRAQKLPVAPVTMESLTPEGWLNALPQIYNFVNHLFSDNFAYTPPSWEAFQQMCGAAFIEPYCQLSSSLLVKSHEGDIAGLLLILPFYRAEKPSVALLKTIAIAPCYRRSSLYQQMYYSFFQKERKNFSLIGSALMRSDNKSLKTSDRIFSGDKAFRHNYALCSRRIT